MEQRGISFGAHFSEFEFTFTSAATIDGIRQRVTEEENESKLKADVSPISTTELESSLWCLQLCLNDVGVGKCYRYKDSVDKFCGFP